MKHLLENWKTFLTEQRREPEKVARPQRQPSRSLVMAEIAKIYPGIKNPELRAFLAKTTNNYYVEKKKELSKYIGNPAHRESFIRLIQHMLRKNNPKPARQQIMQRYPHFVTETIRFINSAPPLLFVWDKEVRIAVLSGFAKDGKNKRTPGTYDVTANRIVINPFAARTKHFGPPGTARTLQHVVQEEILHYVQYNLKKKSPFIILKKVAKGLNIFLPRSMATIIWPLLKPKRATEMYDYYVRADELNAKLSALKIALHKAGKVDPTTGMITSAALKPLLGPGATESHVWPEGIDQLSVAILRVLNPAKVNDIVKYFNMIVKAKTPKSTQQQRIA
jgi:hypothetical protein